jgi:hypothetical protein
MPTKTPDENNTGTAARIEDLIAKSAIDRIKTDIGIHWHLCGDQLALRALSAKLTALQKTNKPRMLARAQDCPTASRKPAGLCR